MATPKRRHSNTRTALRRSQDGIRPKSSSVCSHCKAAKRPHHVCPKCGFYRGRQVMTIKVKSKKEGTK